jgi:aspartate/methionine/tyrosine aminotransferase
LARITTKEETSLTELNAEEDGETESALVAPHALSERANRMPRSAIREIMSLASGRSDVIHLEVGEPDFTTPAPIIEAAFKAVRGGATHYSGNAGRPALRSLVATRASRSGVSIGPEQVVITVGAIGALFTALMSVIGPGDEVLIPDPGWPNYESIVVMADGVPVRYALPESDGFVPDPDEMQRRISGRTKAILINSPGNPTGAVFPPEIVRRIGAIAARTGAYLISDEIYEDLVFDGLRHETVLRYAPEDRLFVISGASKSYAMTGWRLGWLICPKHAAAVAEKLQEPVVSCAPTPSQVAAEAALSQPQDGVEIQRKLFQDRRDIFLQILGPTGLIAGRPRGAFYGLVKIPNPELRALDFARQLLLDHSVAVVPGDTFGASTARMVRIAFTIGNDQLAEGLRRIAYAVSRNWS